MKRLIIPLLPTAALLSSCSLPHLECHTAELLDPPGKRVALVNGVYKQRPNVGTKMMPASSWELEGKHYHEFTVQYARPNRPIIRQEDHYNANALTTEETKRQFIIDPDIPAQQYMFCCTHGKSAAIAKEDFNFSKAKRITPSPKELADLNLWWSFPPPLPDIEEESGIWRNIAQTPLEIIDLGVGITLNVTAGATILVTAVALAPIVFPIQELNRQQQRPAPPNNSDTVSTQQ